MERMLNTFWSPKNNLNAFYCITSWWSQQNYPHLHQLRNKDMYFREQNILKYIKHLLDPREFLETAAHELQDYSPQATGEPGKPVLPALKQTVRATELHPSSYSQPLIYTQESCFNYTECVQSTLLHASISWRGNLWQGERRCSGADPCSMTKLHCLRGAGARGSLLGSVLTRSDSLHILQSYFTT